MIKYEWRSALSAEESDKLAALLDRATRHDAEAEHNTIDVAAVRRTLDAENVRHLVIWMLPHAVAMDRPDEPERIAGLIRVTGAGGPEAEVTAVIDPELRSIGIMTLLLEHLGVDAAHPMRAWARGNHPAAGRISRRFLVPSDRQVWKLLRPVDDTVRRPDAVTGTFTLDTSGATSEEFGPYATIAEFRAAPDADSAALRGLLDAAAAAAAAAGMSAVAMYVDADDRALVNACRLTGFQHDRTDVCYQIGGSA